jgi:hypothetical protein
MIPFVEASLYPESPCAAGILINFASQLLSVVVVVVVVVVGISISTVRAEVKVSEAG